MCSYTHTYIHIVIYTDIHKQRKKNVRGAYTAQDQPDWPDYATGDSSRRETKRQTEKNDGKTNITEWTGLEWNIILRKAENSEE